MSALTDEERSELLSLVDEVTTKSPDSEEDVGLFDEERVCCGRLPAGPYNIVMTALVLFAAFLAFNPVQSLQSTLYGDESYVALGILYAFLCLFNIVASGCVKLMGEKWAMLLGGLFFFAWLVNQVLMHRFYDAPGVLHKIMYFGTSALMGVGGSLLYTAQGSFVAMNAPKGKLAFYTGLFLCLYLSNYFFGGLIMQFVPVDKNNDILLIVLTAVGALAAVFLLLLHQPVRVIRAAKKNYRFSVLDTLRLFVDVKALLMLPLFFFSGIASAFYYGLFAGYPHMPPDVLITGYCLMVFGFGEMVGSFGAGILSSRLGIFVTFVIGVCLIATGLILAVFSDVTLWYLYLLAYFCFGAGDGVFNLTEYTVLGSFFPLRLQAAFAFLRLIIAFGTAAGFGVSLLAASTSTLHAVDNFVYVLAGVLALSLITVSILNFKVARLDGDGKAREVSE